MKISQGRVKKELATHVVIEIEGGRSCPPSCFVCDRLLRTSEDMFAIKEYDCCDACAQKWARPNKNKWKSGWRPSQNDVQEALLVRPPLFIAI